MWKQKTVYPIVLIFFIWFLFLDGCGKNSIKISHPEFIDVSVKEAYSIIENNRANEHFEVLDVRTPEEYEQSHIENAINIDINSQNFQESLNQLKKDQTYLVYCRTGNRSSKAIEMMKTVGFKKVYHLKEGIVGWIESDLSVVQ